MSLLWSYLMKKINNKIIFVSAVSLPLTLLAASNVSINQVSAKTLSVKSTNKQNVVKPKSFKISSNNNSTGSEADNGVSANPTRKNSDQDTETSNTATTEKANDNISAGVPNKTSDNTLTNNEIESHQLPRAASFIHVQVTASPTSSVDHPLGWNNTGYTLSFRVTNQSNTDEVIPKGSKLTIKIEPDSRVPLDKFLIYGSITQSSDIFTIADNHNGSYDITVNKDLVPGTYNFAVNLATRNAGFDWNKPVGSNTTNPDPVPGKVTVTSTILGSNNLIFNDSVYVKPAGYVVPGPGVGAPGYATAGFNGIAELNTDSEYRKESAPVYLPDGTTLRNPNDKSISGSMFFSYIVNYQAAIGSQAGAKLSVKSKDKIDLQHYHLLIDKRVTGGQIEDITNNPLLKWTVNDNEVTVDAGKYMTANNLGYPLFLRVYVPEQSAEAINEVTLQTGPSLFKNKSTFQYIGTDSSTPYFRGGNVTIYDTETFDAKSGLMAFEGSTSLTNKIIVTDYDGYPKNGQNLRAGSYNIKYEVTGNNNTKTTYTRTITVKQSGTPVVPKDPDPVSNVVVHYQDENGNKISADEILTGKIGDGYQTTQKTIPNYTFKEVSGNATGFFTSNVQTVTYIYTKDVSEVTLPVKPAIKPANKTNQHKTQNLAVKSNKHKAQNLAVKKQQKSNPIPNRTEGKNDPLPQTGASKENNGILAALGGMMVLISLISGVWFKRKKK